MNKVKILLIIVLLASTASALTGIKTIRFSQQGIETILFEGKERTYPIFFAALIGAFYYGIYKRKFIAYRAGWGLLTVCFAYSISNLIITIINKDSTWISFCFGIIAGILLFFYCGKWWGKNREYFTENQT